MMVATARQQESSMVSVRVNDVDLEYQTLGDTGPPVVLVHGSWADHTAWQPVLAGLTESCQVIVYDRRGHAGSATPFGEGSRAQDEADVAALIEALGLAPAHLVGNSFGGSIALGVTTRSPGLCASAIVHEPPLMSLIAGDSDLRPMLSGFHAGTDSVVRRLEAGDLEGGARQFVDEIAFFPGAWDAAPGHIRQSFLSNALTWLDEMRDPEWATIDLERLASSSIPALLTRGDHSLPWFPRIIERLHAAMPRTSLVHTFAGAGHAPHATHPDEFVRVVRAFIEGADGAEAAAR
jgi:pimeloyl-ACP methyl ester carboxylesterase